MRRNLKFGLTLAASICVYLLVLVAFHRQLHSISDCVHSSRLIRKKYLCRQLGLNPKQDVDSLPTDDLNDEANNLVPTNDAASKKTCDQLRNMTITDYEVYVNLTVPSWPELRQHRNVVFLGGIHRPETCITSTRAAIIIPYRNREHQLRVFLRHIHPFLRTQYLEYRIYVIELAPGITFNRGALMNIGFLEAEKDTHFDCYIFHDVDLLPEDRRNIYTCSPMPRHMSVACDKFGYMLPHDGAFGGVIAMAREHFQKVNGFSNSFFGWGSEDDDLYLRVLHNNLTIERYPRKIARYTMIRHRRDTPMNSNRLKLINSSLSRMKADGINSLKYDIHGFELRDLYTWFLVSFK